MKEDEAMIEAIQNDSKLSNEKFYIIFTPFIVDNEYCKDDYFFLRKQFCKKLCKNFKGCFYMNSGSICSLHYSLFRKKSYSDTYLPCSNTIQLVRRNTGKRNMSRMS